jgi:hypothetical protein
MYFDENFTFKHVFEEMIFQPLTIFDQIILLKFLVVSCFPRNDIATIKNIEQKNYVENFW